MMDMESFFYKSNTMCPNFKHSVCSANSEYCQPENCVVLYWIIKVVEDHLHNGTVRQVIKDMT